MSKSSGLKIKPLEVRKVNEHQCSSAHRLQPGCSIYDFAMYAELFIKVVEAM